MATSGEIMAEYLPPSAASDSKTDVESPIVQSASPQDPAVVWDSVATDFYRTYPPSRGQLTYGPLISGEDELKLLGSTSGKRVLDLGCGAGFGSVALAKSGAHVIAVDFSARRIDIARQLAEREEVKVEFRQAGLSELIFIPADSIDIVVSAWAINFTPNWARVFRAVSRVLAPGGVFVFSIEHPIWTCLDSSSGSIVAPYRDDSSVTKELIVGNPRSAISFHTHTIGGILSLLTKEGFTLHQVLEPQATAPPTDPWYKNYPQNLVRNIPPVLIVKCEA
jgi:2-polyprenyl-3-methyl-5-hydroxy-6-metoxy-1,4-benzoquinol methylase